MAVQLVIFSTWMTFLMIISFLLQMSRDSVAVVVAVVPVVVADDTAVVDEWW